MNSRYNFPLCNSTIENWTPTRFAACDPYHHNKQQADIVLVVDWKKLFCRVETQIDDGNVSFREFHSLAESFTLPHDMDAAVFFEYYVSNIRPLIQKRVNDYELVYNGYNWIGNFKSETDNTESFKIAEACMNAPTHGLKIVCSVAAAFDDYDDIKQIFVEMGENFLDCLITDEVVKKFRETCYDFYFIPNIQKELMAIQEHLNE